MKRNNISKTILSVIAVAGVLSLAMVAPNAIQLLKPLIKPKWKYQRQYYLNKTIKRLQHQGLIKFEKNKEGVTCVRLTSKGQEKVEQYQFEKNIIATPKHWDGKYRLIIFDIKEGRREMRNQLRDILSRLGLVRLQNSVWVHPYECEEIVVLLKAHFRVGKDVLYVVADRIENDAWLKRKFGLD